ncbi:SDR family NAD(P)-dependent oxidoreductase [Actinosynnema sp. CS-041913]|uniref:SDR family NAD(P)-dependent oxidoreductase n=1 Tax=Actinosynnema sp. CS-041913 TaxID=3239917 RepID=UPI003D8BDB64
MSTTKTAVVIGAGPGLGMSIAHRFGREGYAVALISRTDTRHAGYVAALAEAGIKAEAFTAHVADRDRLLSTLDTVTERFGSVDFLYYGPGAADPSTPLTPITEIDSDAVREAMTWVYPAIDVVGHVLPDMVRRGSGGLLFAGGLSSVRPMPPLGAVAVVSAALRNYAVTLHAGLAGSGVYAGTLTIGGLIERGDIYQVMKSKPELFGGLGATTLDPDDLAETAWALYTERDRAEAVVSVFT